MGQSIFDLAQYAMFFNNRFDTEEAVAFLMEKKERLEVYKNQDTGHYLPCTTRGGHSAFVISGKIEKLADGSGVDFEKSDRTIIIRYTETGVLEMTTPNNIIYLEKEIV